MSLRFHRDPDPQRMVTPSRDKVAIAAIAVMEVFENVVSPTPRQFLRVLGWSLYRTLKAKDHTAAAISCAARELTFDVKALNAFLWYPMPGAPLDTEAIYPRGWLQRFSIQNDMAKEVAAAEADGGEKPKGGLIFIDWDSWEFWNFPPDLRQIAFELADDSAWQAAKPSYLEDANMEIPVGKASRVKARVVWNPGDGADDDPPYFKADNTIVFRWAPGFPVDGMDGQIITVLLGGPKTSKELKALIPSLPDRVDRAIKAIQTKYDGRLAEFIHSAKKRGHGGYSTTIRDGRT